LESKNINLNTMLNGGININITQILTEDGFIKYKDNKPSSYTLDQLIEFFSKEHVNKDIIDYLPRITNIINTGSDINIELLLPILMQIKVFILDERKMVIKSAKNLTQIVSDDFMQLPCICATCNNILFRIGNLKGITQNYER